MNGPTTHVATANQVLNPQYPSSWWILGFSDEVRRGEVVPVKALERDLILWRDDEGHLHCQSAICPHLGANIGYGGEVNGTTVRCPFHGYRYDSNGVICERLGEVDRAPARLRLENYAIEERFGAIFLWNGRLPADHDLPDIAAILPDGKARAPDKVSFLHDAFYFPFPAKWFLENLPDANHISGVHRACDWGDIEVSDETATSIRIVMKPHNAHRLLTLASVRDHARIGQLTTPHVTASEVEFTTLGGALHIAKLAPVGDASGGIGQFPQDRVGTVVCWTPVTENTHVVRFIVVMPRVPVPVLRGLIEGLVRRLFTVRTWAGLLQDLSVMVYRREPANPGYGRLDRGLVRFRRLWDSRVLDRSLWQGDNVHTNGARAGIRWEDRPPERATAVSLRSAAPSTPQGESTKGTEATAGLA